jgi:hypothetical protein
MAVQVGLDVAKPGRHLDNDSFHYEKNSINNKIKLDTSRGLKMPIGRESEFRVSPEAGVIAWEESIFVANPA